MDLPQDLTNQLQKVGDKLLKEKDVLVVSHHDADGITSCAITVDLLKNANVNVDYMCIKQLDSVTIGNIEEYKGHTIVFTDMGSGQNSLIKEHGINNFYVIDHHPPETDYELQVNPHYYGFDGGSDISGAGMAYLLARQQGRKDMAHLGVVGAVGDMQDSKGKLSSINRIAVEDGQSQESILVENDLRMFGRQSRSLSQMLAYSSDPLMPGITGSQQAAGQFIEEQGIELKNPGGDWRSYVELTADDKQKLASAIYMYLLDKNVPEYIIQSMVGEVYTLQKEEFKSELADSKEYATVLNACGRQEQSELGVKVCLGDRGTSWDKARTMLEKHRRNLREGLEFLREHGAQSMSNLYYFDAGGKIKESIIGVVAGMAYGGRIVPPDKPILAFAIDRDDETKLKISSRANWALIRRGIHLGNAMKHCSNMYEGEGGGHDIAAGARIPKERKQDFLNCVNSLFEKQLKG